MSAAEVQLKAEDVIDNVSLPGKRKIDEVQEGSETANKAAKTEEESSPASESAVEPAAPVEVKAMPPKARENRLEQNRKAARESRRRKKVMIEELQYVC